MRTPNLAAYLNTLHTTMPQVRQHLAELLPSAFMHERSVRNALDWYEDNIRNYTNSITEAQALYGKFSHALYGARDRTEAQTLLSTLQRRYAQSGQAKLALVQFSATPASFLRSNTLSKRGNSVQQQSESKPTTFALHQNHPNPFNPSTQINYDLPEPANVSLVVYDVLGRKVAELGGGDQTPGYHSAIWNATDQASGVYFARFVVTSGIGEVKYAKVNKLVLMK